MGGAGLLPVGPGWEGILSSQTQRSSWELRSLRCPLPLLPRVFFILCHFGFSQRGAVREAQKSGKRQLSSPELVIFRFSLMLSSTFSRKKKKQPTTSQTKTSEKNPASSRRSFRRQREQDRCPAEASLVCRALQVCFQETWCKGKDV